MGKVSLNYVKTINYLTEKGYAVPIKQENKAFDSILNINKLVDFI